MGASLVKALLVIASACAVVLETLAMVVGVSDSGGCFGRFAAGRLHDEVPFVAAENVRANRCGGRAQCMRVRISGGAQ
jgi:hypothetical protein